MMEKEYGMEHELTGVIVLKHLVVHAGAVVFVVCLLTGDQLAY